MAQRDNLPSAPFVPPAPQRPAPRRGVIVVLMTRHARFRVAGLAGAPLPDGRGSALRGPMQDAPNDNDRHKHDTREQKRS
jgi:hypothetical protein